MVVYKHNILQSLSAKIINKIIIKFVKKKFVKSILDYDDTYCPILFTIRFSIFFKEFAVNSFFTNATFKAFFMVHFTKGCAAFHTNGLLTYSTFS